jgi:rod shape-determining protein MreD
LSWLWLRQLDAHLRALLPLATAGLAALVDVVPLLGSGAASLTSFSTLCVVFFWSLYRPDLLTPAAAFLVGLIHDGLAGLPLGLTSLLLLLVRHLVVTQQRFFLPRSFPVIWFCFLFVASAACLVRWLLACLWWGEILPARPALFELALTIALYPPISWALSQVHNRVPRVFHAS